VHCRCLITCARLVEYEVIRARRTNERSSEYSSAGRCIGSTNHLFCRRNKNTCMDYSSSARTKKASPSRIKSTRARNFFARQLSVRCFSVSFLEEEEFGTIETREEMLPRIDEMPPRSCDLRWYIRSDIRRPGRNYAPNLPRQRRPAVQ
jgi:hypothetical protein